MGRLPKRAPLRELDVRRVPGTHSRTKSSEQVQMPRTSTSTIPPQARSAARATWAGGAAEPLVRARTRRMSQVTLDDDFDVFDDPAGITAQPIHAIHTRAMTAGHDHDDKENKIPT